MKAAASTQLYLDRGDDPLGEVYAWTVDDDRDMAMVNVGMLTLYASSPERIVSGLRMLAAAVEAQPVNDERIPREVSS